MRNRQERFNAALSHKETDRIPLDIGGSIVSSIATGAYEKLRDKLKLPKKQIQIQNLYSMSARIDEDVLTMLEIDTRFFMDDPTRKLPKVIEKDGYLFYSDNWGFEYARSKKSNSGFSVIKPPLIDAEKIDDIINFKWQNAASNIDIEWLLKRAKFLAEEEKVPVILEPDIGGVFEFPCWLRGTENFYIDLVMQSKIAEAIIDKTVQYKLDYYNLILPVIGGYVDLVRESDDLAGQNGLLISKKTYQKYIKPAHKKVFNAIKKNCKLKISLHSCGSIRELIPDFIDSGVEVLNPVQTSAYNMDLSELKREFGKDIAFWGAGCDSQFVLPVASPAKIREEVKKVVDTLAPGGGFVCAPINMIQSDVPPENIVA
ncbi:MAG: uroporphyrinogen decarboxylase family protein [Candidatus Humimicrobiaceae bacterium]